MLFDTNNAVTPAKAGVYLVHGVDSRLRGNDNICIFMLCGDGKP